MKRIILTNLSDYLYENSRHLLNVSAQKFGIKEIYSYSFDDIIKSKFYSDNFNILRNSKGLGYWLWKPYIILQALEKAGEGDIVIYSDCGIEIIENVDSLINLCSTQEIVLFGNANAINASWTKRDCFILMDCDNELYWQGPHCDASFCLFKKTSLCLEFVTEWLRYGCKEGIIDDSPNLLGLNNLPEFIEHRRDQSILSLLAQKYKLNLFRMPSQFGNHYKSPPLRVTDEFNCINQSDYTQVKHYYKIPYYNSDYGQLLLHHRGRNSVNNDNEKNQTKLKHNQHSVIPKALPLHKVRTIINRVINKFGY